MRAVIQRVLQASVTIHGEVISSIKKGLLVYPGVAPDDSTEDVEYLVSKIHRLRIFEDNDGKMNLDILETGGSVLIVSAFTVHCDARKGRRPSFDTSAGPEQAEPLYDLFCEKLEQTGVPVQRGVFREYMHVDSINDGPICILLDSRKLF